MLASSTKHEFSPDEVAWYTPTYLGSNAMGGSARAWPRDNVPGDERAYLPFWGGAGARSGCCHSSLTSGAAWGQTFDLYDSSLFDKQAPVSDLSYADSTTGRPWAECGQYTSQWWGVDLGSEVYVRYVRLQNRNDCCAERLTDVDIYLGTTAETYTGNALVKSDVSVLSNVMLEVEINALGRYIYLNRPSAAGLTVCKFYDSSLFDKQAPVSDLSYADSTTGRPWAECGQYTSQWWGVDLRSEVYVRYVRLQNRNDCCAERLTDVDIYLGSTAET
ncbi:hypothetical protein EMIHUDRAFT_256681, partial [Emiliania huxleyi CCMP1516]